MWASDLPIRTHHHFTCRVAATDRVVAGVVVAAELGGVVGFEDGVEADEAAGGGVVPAGSDVGECGGGVVDLVEEAVVVDPAGCGAAGVSVGVVLPPGGGLAGVVEVEGVGVVLVGGDLEVVFG